MLEYVEEIKAEKKPQPLREPKTLQSWSIGGRGETLEDLEEFFEKLKAFKDRATKFLTVEGPKPGA